MQDKPKAINKKIKQGRSRGMKVGAINITTHPHTPEDYVKLLIAARRLNVAVPIYGKSLGTIGFLSSLNKGSPLKGVYGEFHRYFDIEIDGRWYNLEKGKQADDEELKNIVIPSHLKPDYTDFRFLFFPEIHRLFFQSYVGGSHNLSPRQAKKILDGLFASEKIRDEFGRVEVVVEPDIDSLDQIFSLAGLRKIEMEVRPPNADGLDDIELNVYDRINDENAEKLDIAYTAAKGEQLTPTKKTRDLARVAKSNGYVVGHGKDEHGKATTYSTLEHPWIERKEYYPLQMSERKAFIEKAYEMMKRFTRRRA